MIKYNVYVSKDHGHYKIPIQPKCRLPETMTKFFETVFRFWGREECNGEHKNNTNDFSVSGSRRG